METLEWQFEKQQLQTEANKAALANQLKEAEEESESEEKESESDEEIESDEESDSEEEDFTRCENETNPIVKLMNEYHDSWNEWKPEHTYEVLLKRVIDEKLCC